MPTTIGHCERFSREDDTPAAVTADGGCRIQNPSPYGGMWAFRITNRRGLPLVQARGVVLPCEVSPLTTVSNNLTETLAVLVGLEYLPAGWSGLVRTDSLNAIRVIRDIGKPRNWLPADILTRVHAVRNKLGKLDYELLAGHPKASHLALMRAGQACASARGYAYCLHNHWAHQACNEAWSEYEQELKRLEK